jgi:multidrug transporter EmrE-like cation transporter
MILAIVNAIIREILYTSFLDELRSHQLSTFTLMLIFFIGTFLVLRFTGLQLTDRETFLMGSIWVVMTISFEFLAGHYVFGNSWEKLIADYNILKGRIWSLILITTFISPYLTNKLIQII